MTTSTSPEPAPEVKLPRSETSRARWATRKMTVKSSRSKRLALLERMQKNHKRTASAEKNDAAAPDGSSPMSGDDQDMMSEDGKGEADEAEEEEKDSRALYFNVPLPSDFLDEEGHPVHKFARNKIRTAKYTPLSFLPKNLWFQFHNIANVFFLFLIVLGFFNIFGVDNPGLNAAPLIFIVALTSVKDAIEDYRRTILDIELNNAPLHRLCNWNNVNVEADNVSMWRRTKKATSNFFGAIWRAIESLWSKKAKQERANRGQSAVDDEPRVSTETHRTRRSMRESLASPVGHRASYLSAHEDIQMTPMASPTPGGQAHFEMPTADDVRHAHIIRNLQPNILQKDHPITGAKFQKDMWKNVVVGDFVRIFNDDEIPADVIILSTADPDGGCYVETKNLDGETNLKVRQALRCGRKLKHARDCERAEFYVESEGPRPNLYKYNGAIHWQQNVPEIGPNHIEDMTEPITIDNLLLRGCNLRNTEWILGVVVYTGHDTKIMQNAGLTPSKRPRIAREMNFTIICNFFILIAMCLTAAIINGVAWSQTEASLEFFDFGSYGDSPAMNGFINFWAGIILFQNLVPISLFITLEIVRTIQAVFIFSDVEMYYEKIDQPCVPKSWNISDDVGQIEYIFSDKTGTLTQNVMEFKKATINGQPYGEAFTEAQAGMQKRLGVDVANQADKILEEIAEAKVRTLAGLRQLAENPYLHDDDLTFIAPDFVEDLAGHSGPEQQAANEFFMLALALCHTVLAEKQPGDPPRMIFKAQSPDEEALVATARDMGFTVLGNSGDGIDLKVLGQDRHYTILNTIEFNSTRKRMSCIVRMPDTGRTVLFCKGADSIIYSRLKKGEQQELRKETAEHLEMFAREGLRTLCIAYKELSEETYHVWKKEHDAAAAALEDREEKLETVAELIEQDLMLIGGTAIEDRLQDGVPDSIDLLGRAGIKLWVLTGDKVETAINIGFSCNLLNNDMELIHIRVDEDETGETTPEAFLEMTEKLLDDGLRAFGMTGGDEDLAKARKNHEPPAPTHGLIVDGFTLRWALDERLKQKFLLLCKECKSVLCCRVSPAQKAAVVSLVKNGLDVMTLSIGDGANDVAMIQEADVGVGIAGVEGRQAAMSSDYAIAQFRFLQRLVLVHGRWSYRRLAETIPNFFYKNILWTFALFWFGIYNNFDMTYLFDYTYILMFALFFTALPVGIMGVLDQDVSDKVSLAVPQLYRRGIERLEWSQSKFWLYMLDGVYQSVMVYYIPYLVFYGGRGVTFNGLNIEDRLRFGVYIAHPAILTINAYILINTYRWDWFMLLFVALSDLFIFFWTGVYTSFTSSGFFFGAAQQAYGQASFWAVFCIVPVVCLTPRFVIKSIQKVYFPYDIDIIREQALMGHFDYLDDPKATPAGEEVPRRPSSDSARKIKRDRYASVDEDLRPIYPPSTVTRATTNYHSQNGSDSTNFTGPRGSFEMPSTYRQSLEPQPMIDHRPMELPPMEQPPMEQYQHQEPMMEQELQMEQTQSHPQHPALERIRPSMDRSRPSFDRARLSMDRLRPSFEASNDMTSAARLSRIESTHSNTHRQSLDVASRPQSLEAAPQHQSLGSRLKPRLRGLSLSRGNH